VWLAAVCIYSVTGVSASPQRPIPDELAERVLGSEPEPERFETRTRPVTVDVRVTATSGPVETPAARSEPKKSHEKRKEIPTRRENEPKRDIGHTIPVAPRLVSERDLAQPHHDYPALDLPLNPGTRVVAVTAGRVKATTKWGGCGKGVILRGRDRFTYTYCHGSKLLVGRGRHVDEGQGIMRSGNTGDSTGPHLHLQIRKPNGKLVCPQDLLPAWNEGEPTSPWAAKRVGCREGGDPRRSNKGKKR
jgi:murein DD-endopeptidase MepM/ murein hydrolase activator NlpD